MWFGKKPIVKKKTQEIKNTHFFFTLIRNFNQIVSLESAEVLINWSNQYLMSNLMSDFNQNNKINTSVLSLPSVLLQSHIFLFSFISTFNFFLTFKQFSLNFQPFFHQYFKLHSLVSFWFSFFIYIEFQF